MKKAMTGMVVTASALLGACSGAPDDAAYTNGEMRISTETALFTYDSTRVRSIDIGGINLLTGGGIYLIGSKSGDDNPLTNYSSVESAGNVMTNNGPAFSLKFWPKGSNVLGFRADVGPVATSIKTLSLPFDFGKNLISQFSFGGNRYFLNGTYVATSYTPGTPVNYSSIPTPYSVYANNVLLGKVGVADTGQGVPWAEVTGSMGKVRVNILSSAHFRSIGFFNHFGTNNLELRFGAFATGERANVEGEIVVSGTKPTNTAVFQAETDLQHQIGRRDADGWSVSVQDTPKRFMSYGPYTTGIAPGPRVASFRLMLDNVTADNNPILTLDVYDARSARVIANRDLTRKQFAAAFAYQTFDVPFSVTAGQQLEFRAFWHGGSYVRQDSVSIR